MIDTKKLSLGLFASVALNIFLLGIVGGGYLSSSHHPREPKHPKAAARDPGEPGESRPQAARHTSPGPGTAARGPKEERRGPRGPSHEGSSDLALLRQMVRIMGGPSDPRIAGLRERKKGELQEIRKEMRAAHAGVHQALTADDWNEDELCEALKALRKTTFESQAKAQEGILTLSSLMTPVERQKLRELPPPLEQRGPGRENRRGPRDRPPHPKGR